MRPPASAGNLSERSDGVTLGGGAEEEKKWWLDPGSNRGHTDFQSVALPTELSSHNRHGCDGRVTMPKIPAPSSPFPPDSCTLNADRSCLVPAFSLTLLPMPTYIYQTIPKKKGQKPKRFELVQSMKDKPLKKHPETGEPVERVITGGCGVVFHGPSIMSMNVPRGRK